jgi:DNA-binding HxlR family transcriptional regulator
VRISKQEGTFKFNTHQKVINADNLMVSLTNNSEKINWDPSNCAVRTVLDRFGDKWSILVLIILGEKIRLRFNEINKEVGPDISQKMLTVTLRTLEADGLISRTIYPEVPPRVEYEITKLGKSLMPHINALAQWADEHMPAIKESRKQVG